MKSGYRDFTGGKQGAVQTGRGGAAFFRRALSPGILMICLLFALEINKMSALTASALEK